MPREKRQETCRWCGELGLREYTTTEFDDGSKIFNEYCKMCKGFHETHYDRNGNVIRDTTRG